MCRSATAPWLAMWFPSSEMSFVISPPRCPGHPKSPAARCWSGLREGFGARSASRRHGVVIGSLRGVGPVNVPDLGEVNAHNAVALTLNEAYTRFPDRPVRQEYLGQVAEAAFRRLTTGDYPSLKGLAHSLGDAVAHRNVVFWSSHPAGER